MSRQYFLKYDEKLFNLGDKCDDIFMILNGVIDIVLTDGFDRHQVLDICGRGSILGSNYVLCGNPWSYEAINHSNGCVHVLQIKRDLLM